MGSGPKTIVYFSATSHLGGAEIVLSSIVTALDRGKYRAILVTQGEGALIRVFEDAGCGVFSVPLPAWRKSRNIIFRYLAVARLYWIFRSQQIEAIHCNSYRLMPYAVWMRRLFRVPVAVHIHDLLRERHIRDFAVDQADYILAVSDCVRRPFAHLERKTQIFYNGIPVARFVSARPGSLRNEYRIPTEAPLLGMVANFTENKRPQLFLKVACEIARIDPRYYFVIVGYNVWQSSVRQEGLARIAEELGIANRVILTGWRDDVPEILKDMAGVLIPSAFESFGLVALEAMAAGAVVFGQSDAGGLREAITHGEDGFLLDLTLSMNSARVIVATLCDQDLCRRIRQKAYEKVSRNFDNKVFAGRLEQFYETILSGTKA